MTLGSFPSWSDLNIFSSDPRSQCRWDWVLRDRVLKFSTQTNPWQFKIDISSIMNIKWNEFRRSDEIRDMSGQPLVTTVIRKKRWRYVGHTLRRNDQRISKQALKWDAKGSRKRGRPKETLKRTLLREAENIGLSSMEEIDRVAQDRVVWRNYLQALCNV